MKTDKPLISVIIPTHNRRGRLQTLLGTLAIQTCPPDKFEVIVVADGCVDDTIGMLKQYESTYALRYSEQPGRGAAVARNEGARLAAAPILLFLDDDIEPSSGLVEAHIKGHDEGHDVIIGYLPYIPPQHPGFYHLKLSNWWDQKYRSMRDPGYRYGYEDLLSGNFSINHELYKKVSGFNSLFRCHEDYELGFRLVEAGARFHFSSDAWGYHRDEVTDLSRSLKRKRIEGHADVQLARLYPQLVKNMGLNSLKRGGLWKLLYHTLLRAPFLSDIAAVVLKQVMYACEYIRYRSVWNRISLKLHEYWYLRGFMEMVDNKEELNRYLKPAITKQVFRPELTLNLKDGIPQAAASIDQLRPSSVLLYYGSHLVGHLPPKAGFEKLRGPHLIRKLSTALAWDLFVAIAVDGQAGTTNTPVITAKEAISIK